MVQSIKWTNSAIENLREIVAGIPDDLQKYSRTKIILNAVEKLEKFPMIGTKLPEMSNRFYHELLIGNYRAVFKSNREMDSIIILAIVQSKNFTLDSF